MRVLASFVARVVEADGALPDVVVAPPAVVAVALELPLLAAEEADDPDPEDDRAVVVMVAAPVAVLDPLVLETDIEFVLTELMLVAIENMPE